ncbi:head-tail connector protein [Pararhizobium antarcticum]|uniref:DNA-packaging protein n=1 Tax=Pararhizobium antarcticum TaxID=1798805 RepID=A0A657LS30_9HYPH|nr:head-tail connector protein [Pararhizobium antarcticum]OJF95895.1 hypothetical protein AX760_18885 [Pararhizobium antarcticum]OJF99337.1 hypothetical protein AX761_11520 [Rhizobium sp. 58]
MTIAELTPPGGEPLTLAETKAHLRIDGTLEDTLIEALIRAVRQYLEQTTGLVLISRTFRLYRDDWPEGAVIPIAKSPVQSIDLVTIYDAAGLPQDVALADAVLDGQSRPARLLLATRPLIGREINGIEIDFTAGFGEAGTDIPDTLKRAMLLHVALLYECRGAVSPDSQPAAVPVGYDRLIAPFCRRGL